MTVTPVFSPLSLQVARDQNDDRIIGGKIYVYQAGTTTLATTYADEACTVPNPNPVLSDGFGRIPVMWFSTGTFKVVVQDASGAQLFVIDNLPGGVDFMALAAQAAANANSALAQATTGDVKFKHGVGADPGWLILNGRTIGNAQSQGSARANADTMALFIYLWNNDRSLTVSGGRGINATQDFNGGKVLYLPDYRGRVPAGCDQMGADARSGRIGGDTVGASLGAATTTLTVDQLPTIQPVITIDGGALGGTHKHVAVSDQQGSHNHTGATGFNGGHSHTYTTTQNQNDGTAPGSQLVNAGLQSATTSGVSDHNHAIATDGLHQHNITVDNGQAAGAHTHSATCAPFGSGGSHAIVQPTILGYFQIKL